MKRFEKLLVLTAFALIALPAAGKDKKEEKKDSTATKSALEKIIEKQTACEDGMFKIRISDGKVYIGVPDSLLGREFVLGSTIKSVSDNANGIVGGKPMELLHFTLARRDSTLLVRSVDSGYLAADMNIADALSRSNIGAIVHSFKPAAWDEDSLALYDVTSVFLEHNKKMSPFLETAVYEAYKRNESYKKDLSYIVGAKAFEDNVSVTSSMSYTYSMSDGAGKSILKDQPFTAVVTRSILLLPEKIYHPRGGDYRIGYFHTEREQLGSVLNTSRTVYLTNRWRLEPSDTAAMRRGELVEPVKPIVFYVDNDFPEWWKPYIKDAIADWNEPFERAGFKNAVVVKDFPTDDPQFDPDNIKYSCVRYAPIGVQNAMGPSWVDPRSGEIITASVYVYHDIIKLLSRWMFVQTAQCDPAVRHTYLSREMLGEGLRYVLRHEVGHCLGLMHNMSASYVIPVESLRDPEFTSVNGTTTSIMDYARFNYVAQPGDLERGVRMMPPRFGSYDYYAIRWGYTPVFDAADLEQEAQITSGWITDSLKAAPFYRYGKQQVYNSFYDPRCQSEDLGDDVVAASRYGVKNLKYIMENFMDWAGDEDPEYEVRVEYFNAILNQYLAYAQHVLLNVGGLYKNEVKDCDEMPAFQNIPREKQLEALNYVFELESDLSWTGPDSIVGTLPIVGSPEKAVRRSIQNMIMYAPLFASSSDGVVSRELSSAEVFKLIYDHVWAPTKKGAKLTEGQRDFQTLYVRTLLSTGGYNIPKSIAESALSADYQPLSGYAYDEEVSPLGELMYNPVAGYEWTPRAIFNGGDITVSTIYGELAKTYKLLKSKGRSGSQTDKAHYKLLANAIQKALDL